MSTLVRRRRSGSSRRRFEFALRIEPLESRMLLAAEVLGDDLVGSAPNYRVDELLVGFDQTRQGYSDVAEFLNQSRPGRWRPRAFADSSLDDSSLARLQFKSEPDVLAVADALARLPGVSYAEPNYVVTSTVTPNDAGFSSLWGLNNTGQSGGTVDADIDAPEAWDLQTGSTSSTVGVIDTGVDYTHPDLYLNIWINQGEIPSSIDPVDVDGDGLITFIDLNDPANSGFVSDTNGNGYIDGADLLNSGVWEDGIDGDGNGYLDDLIGWDFANNDNDPFDDDATYGHGTHVAGTIGAMANNGTGLDSNVVGVNWQVQIIGLKFLDSSGSGFTSDAIEAVRYANTVGADLTNNSWGGGGDSTALYDAIADGGLFVAASGNGDFYTGIGMNTDFTPHYPSSYDLDNIISVAATDDTDSYASFSNFGQVSVDLAAPGVGIFSTHTNGRYRNLSGTSMATPHVAGAAALLMAEDPELSGSEIKEALLNNVDPIAGTGKTVTDGRLNVNKALGAVAVGPRVIIRQSDGSTEVDENPSTSDTYTISLNVQPIDDVTIRFDYDGSQIALDRSEGITFTPDNWDVPQTITVSGVDDDRIEIDHSATITHTVASPGEDYNGIDAGDVIVNITDDEVAPLKIVTGVVEDVTRDAAGNFIWKKVELPPEDRFYSMVVIATINYGESGIAEKPKVARLRNVTDNSFEVKVEGALPGTQFDVHYVAVEEGVYNQLEHGIDMEAVKFTSTVTDGGYTDSWVGEPRAYRNSYTDPVVVGQVMTTNDPLYSVFWASDGTRGDPPSATSLSVGKHTSTDPVVGRVGETIGYVVVESGSGNVGPLGYSAAVGTNTIGGLGNTPPYSYPLDGFMSVETAIVSSAGMNESQGGWPLLYGAEPLTETQLNLAIDEDWRGDFARTHAPEQLAYIVFGARGPGFGLKETGGDTTVFESGSTDSYEISLNTVPAGDVTLRVTPADDQIDLGAGPGRAIDLVFNEETQRHQVDVSATDDDVIEGDHFAAISHVIIATDDDADYPTDLPVRNLSVRIGDDDTATVSIIANDPDAAEPGDDGQFTVTLSGVSTKDIVIRYDVTGTADGEADYASLSGSVTIPATETTATIDVNVIDDAVLEDDETVIVTLSETDNTGVRVDPTGDTATVHIDDDDPGVRVTPGDIRVAEKGATSATYQAVLATRPTNDVTIEILHDVAQVHVSAGTLVFTPDNWDVPQTVTVTAVDDALPEAEHTSRINHLATGDPVYGDTLVVDSVTVTIADNDAPPIQIIDDGDAGFTTTGSWRRWTRQGYQNDVHEAIPGGSSDKAFWTFRGLTPGQRYQVSATWTPNGNRTTAAPYSVFDDSVLVYREQINQENLPAADAVVAGTRFQHLGDPIVLAPDSSGTLTVELTDEVSGFRFSNRLNADAIRIEAIGPKITITESDGGTHVTEGGLSDSYEIALGSSPTAPVDITVTAGSSQSLVSLNDVDFSPVLAISDITDTTPRTVYVRAFDDDVVEGDHQSTITHVVTSTGSDYDGVAIVPVVAGITDNDVLPTLSIDSVSVDEGDAPATTTASFTITLTPASGRTVTVNYATVDGTAETADGDYTATSGTLVFAAGQTTKTINVTVLGDDVSEPDETFAVNLSDPSEATILTGVGVGEIRNDDFSDAPLVRIVDNGDAGFSTSGTWVHWVGQGFQGDVHEAIPRGSVDVARWTFSDLPPGPYQVSATWSTNANRATRAPYRLLDGSSELRTEVVNQEITPTPDAVNSGTPFQNLGTPVFVSSGSLVVELSDRVNGSPYANRLNADAIRIERLLLGGPQLATGVVTSPTTAILSSAAMDGNDGARPVLDGNDALTPSTLTLIVQEDQLRDSKRSHTTEQVAYVVFEKISPAPLVASGSSGSSADDEIDEALLQLLDEGTF